jgi:diamine N-acetyltransferase
MFDIYIKDYFICPIFKMFNMNNCYLKSSKVSLRPLEPDDLEILYDWENNPDNWIYSNTQKPFSRYELKQYIENSVYDIYTTKQQRFMIDALGVQNKTVGIVDLFEFDPNNLKAGVGILVASEYRGKGFAKETLELLIEYCNMVLNLHQLFANITVDNEKSISLFKKQGFEISGIKKDWIRIGNFWIDEYTLQKIF